ncbi:hypothetical protein VTK73DRAFT_9379 [Phialemonium thermophilum]|uniref:Vacuolar protein sorting-associated protein 62 n=1 Tax=Phialemonium thermophilum TaxID=223376 RepID=A0ABR3W2P4_9PEZI
MVSVSRLARLLALVGVSAAAPRAATLHKRDALPDYALRYAPLSYLHSNESWFLSDVEVHLANVQPEVNFSALGPVGSVTLDNLASYASNVYLTAAGSPILNPENGTPGWLQSRYGIPDASGRSAAPGLIIAAEKDSSTTDVFYFYFYSYNYGGKVLDINFDDHVGDWEHVMIRFVNGSPYAVYVSQHSAGSAYYWDVVSFRGDRPITYVGRGGHANYVTAGTQEYTIALGLIKDSTDAGYLWDMTLNYRGYWYDVASNTFSAASGLEGEGGASWLSWGGMWGDQKYPDDFLHDIQTGQYCISSECHYVSGPTGPVAKNLGRKTVCQNDNDDCTIFNDINEITHQSKKKARDVHE